MTAPTLTVAEVLERAADLIEPEGAWTQGAYARDRQGRALTGPNGSKAVCFCAEGAVLKSFRGDRSDSRVYLILVAVSVSPYGSIAAFNDAPERTQAEVVAALRTAAAKAKEQEK